MAESQAQRPMTFGAPRPVEDTRPKVDLLKTLGWLLGGYLVVFGAVALARAGFDDFGLFQPQVDVFTFHASRLFAMIVTAAGGLVWVGVMGEPDVVGLRFLGGLLLVAGVVFVIEPDPFRTYLATHVRDGIHLGVLGTVVLLLTWIPPFRVGRAPEKRTTS